jgi:hypothetical protein
MSDQAFGSVMLFHPKGPRVSLPVKFDTAAGMLATVTSYLDAGWLVREPGLGAGEKREEIGYVVRRTKYNEDGSKTPVIDLYPANDALSFATLSLYLNTPANLAEFEAASGIRVASLKEYDGENKIERGKNPRSDSYVTRAPKPFGVVWQDNPFYNAEEAKTCKDSGKPYIKPKRKFVRWPDAPAALQQVAGATPQQAHASLLGVDAQQLDKLLAEATTMQQLQAVWVSYVQPANVEGRLTTAELEALTNTKDARKMTLGSRQPPPSQANYGAAGGSPPQQAGTFRRPLANFGADDQSGSPVTNSGDPVSATGEIPW